MKQPTSKTQIKLNDEGAKSLYEIYRVLQKESPYLKLSWSELLSEIVTSMKNNHLDKEASFLKLKFFDKNSYLKQAGSNDVSEDDVFELLKERREARQTKKLKLQKKASSNRKASLTEEGENAETA